MGKTTGLDSKAKDSFLTFEHKNLVAETSNQQLTNPKNLIKETKPSAAVSFLHPPKSQISIRKSPNPTFSPTAHG